MITASLVPFGMLPVFQALATFQPPVRLPPVPTHAKVVVAI
jgi:hypothetical protein